MKIKNLAVVMAPILLSACFEEAPPRYWAKTESVAKVCSDNAWRKFSNSDGSISIANLERMHWNRVECLGSSEVFDAEEPAWCFFYADGNYGEYKDCLEAKTYFTSNSDRLERVK